MIDKVALFAPAELSADTSHLPAAEKAALEKIIAAAKLMDPIFDRQAYADNPSLREKLAADRTPEGKLRLHYFDIMRGPWDRQDTHYQPFAIDMQRPPGAGFYPHDLTPQAFRAWVADHPADRENFEGLFSIIRGDGDALRAIPYHEAYAEWLGPAATLLREAAGLTENASLRKFLLSRAAAFESNDYYESDKDWMDLDSLVEVTIGPYETYEDLLLGLKTSFEAFVTVTDPVASEKLSSYKKLLREMEANLPVPDDVKTTRGSESPIRVVDLVYSSGDARKSVQTIAFNLPNDERVRAEKGAKKVLLRNVIEMKFERIMRPIAERILDPSQLHLLSAEAFFQHTLLHELSHSLGPAFVLNGNQVEVRRALEATYSTIEEAKADVMGAYNVLFLIRRGEFPADLHDKMLVSYFAGLFRSTRFGVGEAHGQGAALQINHFLEAEAVHFDRRTRQFRVDIGRLEAAITVLLREICLVQHRGDKAAADAMLAKDGVVSEPMKAALDTLDGVPIDIRPIYPIENELSAI